MLHVSHLLPHAPCTWTGLLLFFFLFGLSMSLRLSLLFAVIFSLVILCLVLSFGMRFLSFFFFSFVDHQIAILWKKNIRSQLTAHRFIKMKQFTSYDIMFHVINRKREKKKSRRLKAKEKEQQNKLLSLFKLIQCALSLSVSLLSSGLSLAVFFSYWLVSFWFCYRSHWE